MSVFHWQTWKYTWPVETCLLPVWVEVELRASQGLNHLSHGNAWYLGALWCWCSWQKTKGLLLVASCLFGWVYGQWLVVCIGGWRRIRSLGPDINAPTRGLGISGILEKMVFASANWSGQNFFFLWQEKHCVLNIIGITTYSTFKGSDPHNLHTLDFTWFSHQPFGQELLWP